VTAEAEDPCALEAGAIAVEVAPVEGVDHLLRPFARDRRQELVLWKREQPGDARGRAVEQACDPTREHSHEQRPP
jgi:hypothetical protein